MMKNNLVKRETLSKMDLNLGSAKVEKQNVFEQTIQLASTEKVAAAPQKPAKRQHQQQRSSGGASVGVKRVLDFDAGAQPDDNAVSMEAVVVATAAAAAAASATNKSKPRSRSSKAKKRNEAAKAQDDAAEAKVIEDIFEFVSELEDKALLTKSSSAPVVVAAATATTIKKSRGKRNNNNSDNQQQPPAKKAATEKKDDGKKARSSYKSSSSSSLPEEQLEIFIEDGYVCNKHRIKGRRLTRIRTNNINVPFSERLIPIDSMRYTIFSSLSSEADDQWIATLHIHNEDTFIEAGTKLIKLH